MKDRRFHYVDAARGIAVLLVIYGHTFRESMRAAYAWCDFSYALVYRFHVSLLFLLSGFGYALTLEKNKTLTEWRYLGKKAKALLLPWFSYSVLIYVIFVAAQLLAPCRALLENTAYQKIPPAKYLAAMLKNENPYSFHLWYLQTLFLFTAVNFLKDKFLSEKYARRAAILLILSLPAFYTLFCRDWIWVFKGFFQKYLFFLLGTLLVREKVEKKAGILAAVGACSFAALVLEICFLPVEIYDNPYIDLGMSYVDNAITVGICLGILSVCILWNRYLGRLAQFGRNTMRYYLYHQPFCCALLGMLLYEKLHFSAVATVAACMVSAIALPWLFGKLIRLCRLDDIFRKIGLPA